MSKIYNITVIIPIFNERENISLLLEEIIINFNGINILIINDGSTDGVINNFLIQ